MSLKIYHNNRCRKSRETLALLESKGKEAEIVEYLKTPPTQKELKAIIQMLGINASDLIRKGETLYKENYKGKEYSESEWIKIMINNPVLIERPIVISNGKAAIGRPPESVLEIL